LDNIVIDDDTVFEDLEFTLVSSDNLSCRIVQNEEGTFLICEPFTDWFGTTYVELSVFDGLSNEAVIINISVNEVNDPPYFTDAVQGIIELSILEDEHFEFTLIGDDIDSDDLTFVWSGPHLEVDGINGTVKWDPVQENVGTTDFRITLLDNEGGESVLLLRITVIEVNDPPTVLPVSDIEVMVGEKKSFKLNAYDEEGRTLEFGSNVSLVWIDEDANVHINASSEYIGINPVKVYVSDGLNTVYLTFNITVRPEGDGSNSTGKDDRLQYILGGAGMALAIIAILFLGFIFLRRSEVDDEVMLELEDADKLYDRDMGALEEEYGSETEHYEE
jgi:hypothetical protein